MSKKLDQENAFIEKFGLLFERSKVFPRVAGRIFGYLLICDPPHQSANQLIKRLKVAKSSVSSMMRVLIQREMVEQISIPGERSRYYRIREGGWESMFIKGLERLIVARSLMQEGLQVMQGKKPALKKRIKGIDEIYGFYEEELPKIAKRWEVYKKKRKK